jgi:phospholipase C
MTEETEDPKATQNAADTLPDSSRRRFLGGVAVLGAGATLSACGGPAEPPGPVVTRELSPAELDKALHDNVKNVVVIYGENRSFNNLFADFPGVQSPLSALKPAESLCSSIVACQAQPYQAQSTFFFDSLSPMCS